MAAAKPGLLVTTTTLPRFAGDPEPRFVLDLGRALSDRFEVTILAPCSPGAALEEVLEGVRVVRYRYAPVRALETLTAPGAILHNLKARPWRFLLVPLLMLGLAIATRIQLRRGRYALVHAHWLVPQGLVQALVGGRTPFVVSAHGSDVFALTSPLFRWFRAVVRRRAAAVTVASPALAEALRGTVDVIPMGVDLSRFVATQRRERTAINLLFVGRLVEGKGVQVLIEAVKAMIRPGLTLTIAGDGPLRGALEAQAANDPRIRFLGGVDHSGLPALYAAADIFVSPSVISASGEREGLPVVLLEAAACGLPLIGSDIGGIPDMVVTGETGLLVPEKDPKALGAAIERLAGDAQLRQKLGQGAQDRARQFDWPVIAARFATIFEKVVKG
jgi:glycosyltransferase involved in cell wall biosynthesis